MMKMASIDDDARLPCGTHRPKIILLRIFQGRDTSWYQNFGYEPDYYRLESNKVRTLEAMQKLRNLPARQLYLEKVRSNHSPSFEIDPVLLSELFTKYPPGDLKLGDYMVNIWNQSCSDYSRLEEFIRFTNGSWSPMIQMIEQIDELTNNDLCR